MTSRKSTKSDTPKKHRRAKSLKPHCELKLFAELQSLGGDRPHYVIGLDEVGRGCLAGPVVAGCAAYRLGEPWPALPKGLRITDSKKLTYPQRKAAQIFLEAVPVLRIAVASASVAEIDERNILHASGLAMRRAFDLVFADLRDGSGDFDYTVVVDGNYLPRDFRDCEHEARVRTLIKGDAHSFAVAAAAICAKNHRDEFMWELARSHPGYGWETNVGYSSPDHRTGLRTLGQCEWHRRSFQVRLDDDADIDVDLHLELPDGDQARV